MDAQQIEQIVRRVLASREEKPRVHLMGVMRDGASLRLRFEPSRPIEQVRVHIQSSAAGEGGAAYSDLEFTAEQDVDCRGARVQDFTIAVQPDATYYGWLIPLVRDNSGASSYLPRVEESTYLEFGPANVDAFTLNGLQANDFADIIHTHKATEVTGLAAVATSGSASDLVAGNLPYGRFPSLAGTWNAGGATVDLTGALRSSAGLTGRVGTDTTAALIARTAAHATAPYAVLGNGKNEWGDGSAARDCVLERIGAAQMQFTNTRFQVRRASGGDPAFTATTGGANVEFLFFASGRQEWGAGGASVRDTFLYRNGAGTLKTDGAFTIGGALDHDGTTVGLYGATPVARAAAIPNADGTLADITTKFNNLLTYLRSRGDVTP